MSIGFRACVYWGVGIVNGGSEAVLFCARSGNWRRKRGLAKGFRKTALINRNVLVHAFDQQCWVEIEYCWRKILIISRCFIKYNRYVRHKERIDYYL